MTDCKTLTYRIWIGGNYDDAVRTVREFCQEGACFAVQPADFVYTGGMESGVCVTLINYPRFPKEAAELEVFAGRLADLLKARLFQDSYSIEGPERTVWVTTRGQ
ncbi:hypothetical protein [Ruegeria sp. HKCCA4812]|uniref:hypothetical protein n=1 Tax=Ruegeria sp. HKCCA4812 TaxID=2682993 RepID=UPI00148813A2|nr:hypothetical protein [Ruegeria sp. HKCCA4812]